MSSETTTRVPPDAAPASTGLEPGPSRPPRLVGFRLTAGAAVRSGAKWGAALGAYVAIQALAYASTYKTPTERAKLAGSLVSSGTDALVGPGHSLQTVAGYTAWKSLMAVAIIASVWGLLTSTKLLRGEEDSGRWELVLAGPTTRRQASLQSAAGLGAGLIGLWTTTSIVLVVTGRVNEVSLPAPSMMFLGATVALSAGMFMTIGLLASQLAASRKVAAAYCAAVLAVAFATRMVADSAAGVSWLRWSSPLGWIEMSQPLTGSHLTPLLLAVGFIFFVAVTSLTLAGRRDIGVGVLPADTWVLPSRPPSTPLQLALRSARGTLAAWSIGASALAALLGSEAKLAAKALAASPAADKLLIRLGGTGGAARAYLGLSFIMFSLLASLVVAGQLTSARREESSGRLDHILARPSSRTNWLCGRASLAALAAVLVGLLAGLFTWVASLSEHLGIAWSSYMGAGLNTVAPSIALLGAGVAVFGWRPQMASGAIYGLIVWSFLAELLAGALVQVRWLLDLSVFHYVKPAPAQAPDPLSASVMVAIGVALTLVGMLLFQRRDLAGD